MNDRWLFRFPRRSEVAAALERTDSVLARLPTFPGVLTPVRRFAGRPGPSFPYPFAGYEWIDGVGADQAESLDTAGFARSLGAALSGLHASAADELRTLGVAEARISPRDRLGELEPHMAVLSRVLPPDLARRCRPFLVAGSFPRTASERDARVGAHDEVDVPAPFAGPLVPIHNDLSIEHLIVDPATGRLRGIIDWDDVAIGDPVVDFVPLYCWRGPDLVSRVLDGYERPLDSSFHRRLRFLARVHSLLWLGEAAIGDPDRVEVHIGWVRQAFDDSRGRR